MRVIVRRPLFLFWVALGFSCAPGQQAQPPSTGWESVPAILARIVSPVFPDKDYPVTEFGASGDGVTDCTRAFAAAIDRCSAGGGGRVLVPAGTFVTGAIHLKSNVNLHLEKGATVRFSTNPRDYLPAVRVRWEGVDCMNYSPLLYAYGEENLALTGEGTLDGQGSDSTWWDWKGRKGLPSAPSQADARARLFAMGEKGIPVEERVFGEGAFLRPNFFVPYRCRNLLVEGVTFRNAPMWFLHPVLCRNVTVLRVRTEGQGPNNDGCDPESCTDVLIKDCVFDNGDDCIAVKSGRNADGRRVNVPSENIIVQGCTMKNGHGGVVVGSETSGGVRNVFAEDCVMDSPLLDRALRIKTNAMRGGIIENIFMRRVRVREVAEAVMKIDYYYEEGDAGAFTPVVRNIDVRDVECGKSRFAVWIRAYQRSPATHVVLENCLFNNVAEQNVLENVRDLSLLNVSVTPRTLK